MYSEYRELKVSASMLPTAFAQGLMSFLEKYPYGCTEQIISKAFPTLMLSKHADFKINKEFLEESFNNVIKTLRRRLTSYGGFGLWSNEENSFDFPTLYALHYLTEAKEHGLTSGNDLLERGIGYLQSGSLDNADSLHEARLWAYSLYIQARNDIVPRKSLETLKGILEAKYQRDWMNDLTGVYLAGTYALLKMNEEGQKIMGSYKRSGVGIFDWNYFYDKSIRESQYLYIAGLHYPEIVKSVGSKELQEMISPLLNGE
jgi:uncharacterized protein YfaS (alpha-2-macroglobulin family)